MLAQLSFVILQWAQAAMLPKRYDHVIRTIKCLLRHSGHPKRYFAFVFLLPKPYWTCCVNRTATYVGYYFITHVKMMLCYCWSNRASSGTWEVVP